MSKYTCPAGEDIDMLVEECGEVVQAAMKIKRFGPNDVVNVAGSGGGKAIDRLHQEIGDVFAIVERMIDSGELDPYALRMAIQMKHHRLNGLFGTKYPLVLINFFKNGAPA